MLLGLILGISIALLFHYKLKILFKYFTVFFASKTKNSGFSVMLKLLKGEKDIEIEVGSAFQVSLNQFLLAICMFVLLPLGIAALCSFRLLFYKSLDYLDIEAETHCEDPEQDMSSVTL